VHKQYIFWKNRQNDLGGLDVHYQPMMYLKKAFDFGTLNKKTKESNLIMACRIGKESFGKYGVQFL
jgi:hypothetical protein